MKYSEQQLNKWTNVALKLNGVDKKIEDILREEKELYKDKKKPKDYQPYYIKYAWKSQEEEDLWIEYIEKEIRKLHPEMSEDKVKIDISIIEMMLSLSGINIMKEAMKGEDIKEDKLGQLKLF